MNREVHVRFWESAGLRCPRHSTIGRNITICPMRSVRSAVSWRRCTTKNGCTRPWAICPRQSSRRICCGRITARTPLRGSFLYEFFRHREIFRSDVIRLVRERRNRRSPAHRLDEFPVGYSSVSCTPAALASASPTGIHSATQARCRLRTFQPTAKQCLNFLCHSRGQPHRPLLIKFTQQVMTRFLLIGQNRPSIDFRNRRSRAG